LEGNWHIWKVVGLSVGRLANLEGVLLDTDARFSRFLGARSSKTPEILAAL